MENSKNIMGNIFKALGLFMLLGFGILLFFMREQKLPKTIPHQIKVKAKTSKPQIVEGEFLIAIDKKHINELPNILEPLGLYIKAPLLNWILVASKNNKNLRYINLDSKEADDSRLILYSLMEHPYLLEAQYNLVLQGMLSSESINKELLENHHISSTSIDHGENHINIALIDQFLSSNTFSFYETFAHCRDRVKYLAPFKELGIAQSSSKIAHGEILLLALRACKDDNKTSIFAIERSSKGQAQSFLATLFAAQIDVCKQSIVPCPANFKNHIIKNKAQVVLLPFGSDAPELLQFSSDMIKALKDQKIIVVTAAGNNQDNASNFFPSAAPGTISVGSINTDGDRSHFSNWGTSIDILAPGQDIKIAYPNGEKVVEGTSLSAAYVTSAIASMLTFTPDLSWKTISYILKITATPLNCEQYCPKSIFSLSETDCQKLCCGEEKQDCGLGRMNESKAIQMAQNIPILQPLIDLSHYYLIFSSKDMDDKKISIKNIGGNLAKVITKSYDDNVVIEPNEFMLNQHAEQTIQISLKREPFIRESYKIEFISINEDKNMITDSSELYIEYVPKK